MKNRIILPALILNFPMEGVRLSDAWKHFYRRRAEGGAGLMIVGACYVHPAGRQDELQIGVDHDGWLPELEDIARVIRKGGATPALQLNHAGRYSMKEVTGLDPVAPSPIFTRYTKSTPKELSTGEVEEIIQAFADAALRAKNAGFEAIELLGATGYLISQFLSPVTNERQDRFGGDSEDRMTFVRECIGAIQSKVGNDYPIIFRLSSLDNVPGGMEAEDQRILAHRLAEWGVNLINVTAGWHDAPVPQIGSTVPQGHFVSYAARIKKDIDIPVSCAVRITEPEFARQVISDGMVDMVTMGRALIADPDWPRKAQAGKEDEIRRCICCCHCFDRAFARTGVECSINAGLGKADYTPSRKSRRVLVIGGGPAGMEAARVLAERGHSVELWEKDSQLGGELRIASLPPYKDELIKLAQFQSRELNRLGVKVRPNTVFEGKADGFDGIVLATGAREKTLAFPGITDIPRYRSSEVLSGRVTPRDPVVIVGAGLVGGETADYLSSRGFQVSMVEILNRPFADMGASVRWVLAARLQQAGVNIYTSSQIWELQAGRVIVQTPKGDVTLQAGCLITAVGFESNPDMVEKVEQAGIPFCIIGDGKQPRRIKEAIQEGYWAATDWVEGL